MHKISLEQFSLQVWFLYSECNNFASTAALCISQHRHFQICTKMNSLGICLAMFKHFRSSSRIKNEVNTSQRLYNIIFISTLEFFDSIIRICITTYRIQMKLILVCCWTTSSIFNYLITDVALLPKCMYRSTHIWLGIL